MADANDRQTPPRSQPRTVVRVAAGQDGRLHERDIQASEVPVALEYNGISHATMLATPADLEDFAYGFSFTEGIIASAQDVRGVEVQPVPEHGGIVVAIEISSACEYRLKQRRRALTGRTGCGLCGVDSLPEVVRDIAPVAAGAPVKVPALFQAQQAMRAQQWLFEETGATHAAGWATRDGRLHLVREDVGRHNALDKLIGALIRREDLPVREGMALVSSRASFEMVQKSAAAGIDVLVALSAPTALAIDLAVRLNVGLAGFMREQRCTLYAHANRFA
ncbi:formate dehydrogenase accessory sulfurtransferase FdhD [Allofranklinella schreckenbergeri]|uniref:Sulfur carrier protein FdhD n=1 Tax=Allofranklinella schreckenbergeri TaxID=1076744 RepID=A0A3M6QC40_9BURK|nr:formate dehydrogenase accessory sulfurtransferase FdhD [Allofranklinella schreckenbergeri]RMX00708.1 formate dehydrogenase accessory sulfurtransferase FdhD [Allofranklinella schreckenbergeri]RMX06083.1 formate dehydrogenase accessory sulfurtransferase FdhD [Allofranklinella schreckenbergeri]